jgi:hypothetical protein
MSLLGVKEAVEMVANATEVVNGEVEEEKDTLGVRGFGNDMGVGCGEFCLCASVVCLRENWYPGAF